MAQGGAERTQQPLDHQLLIEGLQAAFGDQCAERDESPAIRLAESLGEGVDPHSFWDLTRESLGAGTLGLIFVADPRFPALQRVADFLNDLMHPEGLGAAAPSPLRATLDPLADLAQQLRVWDEHSFFQELAGRRGPDEAAIADAILAWARDRGLSILWHGDEGRGGFTPSLEVQDHRFSTATLWTDGAIDQYAGQLQGTPPFSEPSSAARLRDGAAKVPDPLDLAHLLADFGVFESFLGGMDWIVDTVLASR